MSWEGWFTHAPEGKKLKLVETKQLRLKCDFHGSQVNIWMTEVWTKVLSLFLPFGHQFLTWGWQQAWGEMREGKEHTKNDYNSPAEELWRSNHVSRAMSRNRKKKKISGVEMLSALLLSEIQMWKLDQTPFGFLGYRAGTRKRGSSFEEPIGTVLDMQSLGPLGSPGQRSKGIIDKMLNTRNALGRLPFSCENSKGIILITTETKQRRFLVLVLLTIIWLFSWRMRK